MNPLFAASSPYGYRQAHCGALPFFAEEESLRAYAGWHIEVADNFLPLVVSMTRADAKFDSDLARFPWTVIWSLP